MVLAENAAGKMGASVDDWDIVNLLFLNSSCDSEIVWLLSSDVLYLWEMMHVRKLEVKHDKFWVSDLQVQDAPGDQLLKYNQKGDG